MIRDKSEKHSGPIEIDLTGPQGNAYYILGVAADFCKQINRERKKTDYVVGADSEVEYNIAEIQADMTSGDYEHLLEVFEKYFGEFVILYR